MQNGSKTGGVDFFYASAGQKTKFHHNKSLLFQQTLNYKIMEEIKPSSFRVAINQGLLLGLALIIFSLILYVAGTGPKSSLNYLTYLIIVIGMFLSMKQWRDKFNNGFITYGNAFKHGFYVILITGILTAIWTFIFYNYIAPDEVAKIIEATEENLYKSQPNMSEEQVEMALKWSKMFVSPKIMALTGFFGNIILGVILGAILSFFIKKEKPAFSE